MKLFHPKSNWVYRGKTPGLDCDCYTWGVVCVCIGKEGGLWHLSISTPSRNPTWEEIKAARYDFCPHDVTMAMLLPPPEEYVNFHSFCFHLWEIPESEGKAKE